MQRAMDTTKPDDIAMVNGQVYEVGFEVHLWEYTTRDHYVSFPMTLGVGVAADIMAVSFAGTGPEQGPNWAEIPKVRLQLFQPGIATWEFLTGNNAGKEYFDAGGQLVGQMHAGSAGVNGGVACAACHRVRTSDPGGASGAMEDLTDKR